MFLRRKRGPLPTKLQIQADKVAPAMLLASRQYVSVCLVTL